MIRRRGMLAAIRQRKETLGRAALALFACASLASATAPCDAMSAPLDAENDAAAHAHHGGHGRANAPARAVSAVHDAASHHGAERHGAAQHHVPHDAARHGAAHDAAAQHHVVHGAAQHDPAHDPAPSSPICPHCPLAGGMSGHTPDPAHAFCAASDDSSDRAQPSGSSWLPKHVLPPPILALPPPGSDPPPGTITSRTFVPIRSPVALNVRHCVYLI